MDKHLSASGWRYLRDLAPERADAIRARCEALGDAGNAALAAKGIRADMEPCVRQGLACGACLRACA